MLACEYKVLFLLLVVNLRLSKCYGDIDSTTVDNDESAEDVTSSYAPSLQHEELASDDFEHVTSRIPPTNSLVGITPANPILASYLESADAKRSVLSQANADHYESMLMDGLLEEWRPFNPHTDAEALQMVRDFLASRDVNSDLANLRPEHANHEEWRERLKHLLIHYVQQPYIKENPGLHRAMRWYLNKLKHTIWARHRLLRRRMSITKMNLLFGYLQTLDHAVDQNQYRFDIYKEIDRTVALKKRLEKLSTSQEVKMNPELSDAFKYYIDRLSEALEETAKHSQSSQVSNITIQNMSFAPKPEIFPKKITTYVDIVQDFIERKKAAENVKDILDGKTLDTVGGIRTFLEHHSTTTEVERNATLADAINTFLGKLKKLPSHHKLDRHLKRETIQKMVTKYEVVYEYLSKLAWKRSGSTVEILRRALDSFEVQNNATLVDAIRYYLEHCPTEEDEEAEEETEVAEEEARKRREIPEDENVLTPLSQKKVDKKLIAPMNDLHQGEWQLESSLRMNVI